MPSIVLDSSNTCEENKAPDIRKLILVGDGSGVRK